MENERVCPQAMDYARGFALRMELEVFLLMIVDIGFANYRSAEAAKTSIKKLERRVGKQFSDLTREFFAQGITVSASLKIGSPATELLKFLAGRPPFQQVIWGSDETLPQLSSAGGTHWIIETAASLDCPLFAVSRKPEGSV